MSESYDYDLFVIGGGSGGLASAKAAADLGAKVAVADFVKPSPAGTTWGLGGTCVNVGCIPKKLMHISSLYRETQMDAHGLGWDTKSAHSWEDMVSKVNQYIKSLNWGAKTELRTKGLKYYNKFAVFVDPHTVELEDAKGRKEKVSAKYFLIACGGRPNMGNIPGAKECCISSDDIFWQKKAPGKTLVIGASYIALECAGFIAGFGFDTTVMVRSIFLRGFDQECANKIANYMKDHGVKFEGVLPDKFEKTESGQVKAYVNGKEFGTYDTVLMAIGRTGCAGWLNVEAAGLEVTKSGKLICQHEQTSVPHIYAVGDVIEGMPELTPVAIQAGKLLMKRLFNGSKKMMDYTDIATAVFTPIEYGTVGYSEEAAIQEFGKEIFQIEKNDNATIKAELDKRNIKSAAGLCALGLSDGKPNGEKFDLTFDENQNFSGLEPAPKKFPVSFWYAERIIPYHSIAKPLEWNTNNERSEREEAGYMKLICDKEQNEKVIGVHVLGPNAGEVIQGISVAIRCGATKEHFDDCVGIHPTFAESYTTMTEVKAGKVLEKGGC